MEQDMLDGLTVCHTPLTDGYTYGTGSNETEGYRHLLGEQSGEM